MILDQLRSFVNNPVDYELGKTLFQKYRNQNDPKFDQFFNSVVDPNPGTLHFKMLVNKIKGLIGLYERNPGLLKNLEVIDTPKIKQIKVNEIGGGPRDLEKLIVLFQDKTPIEKFTFLERKLLVQHIGLPIQGRLSNNNTGKALEDYRKVPENFLPKNKSIRIIENFDDINYDELPEDMKLLYDECKQLVKDAGIFHSKAKGLEEIPEKDDERKVALNKAIALDDIRKANWDKIKFWWKTKGDPAPKAESDVVKLNGIQKKLKNLATNISRTKTKIKDLPNHKKIKKWQKNLEDMLISKKKLEDEGNLLLADDNASIS